MNSNSYKIENTDKYTLIQVNEDKFTAKIAPEVKAELANLAGLNTRNIIFDLSNSSYCDSSGLSVVLVAHRICKENNGCLVICGIQPAVKKLIDISQLNSVLNITPTKAEAIDFIFMDELERDLNDSDSKLN